MKLIRKNISYMDLLKKFFTKILIANNTLNFDINKLKDKYEHPYIFDVTLSNSMEYINNIGFSYANKILREKLPYNCLYGIDNAGDIIAQASCLKLNNYYHTKNAHCYYSHSTNISTLRKKKVILVTDEARNLEYINKHKEKITKNGGIVVSTIYGISSFDSLKEDNQSIINLYDVRDYLELAKVNNNLLKNLQEYLNNHSPV